MSGLSNNLVGVNASLIYLEEITDMREEDLSIFSTYITKVFRGPASFYSYATARAWPLLRPTETHARRFFTAFEKSRSSW